MTKREIIIVSIMGVAAVGAAFDFLVSKGSDEAGTKAGTATDPSVLIAQVQGTLASLQFDPVQQQILERTKTDWRDDLFYPGGVIRPAPSSEAGPVPGTGRPVFTGYLNINGTALAIINGRDYVEGDWLENGAYQILNLSPDHVELRPSQGDQTLIVEIEETSLTW